MITRMRLRRHHTPLIGILKSDFETKDLGNNDRFSASYDFRTAPCNADMHYQLNEELKTQETKRNSA